jgi:hypothetical protein
MKEAIPFRFSLVSFTKLEQPWSVMKGESGKEDGRDDRNFHLNFFAECVHY